MNNDTAIGKLLTFQDAKGNVTTYEYVSGKPYLVAKIKSVKSYQTLDSNSNVTFHETENITEIEYTYDAFNRVTSIRDYDKPGSSSSILKSYVYDAYGRVTKSIKTDHTNGGSRSNSI